MIHLIDHFSQNWQTQHSEEFRYLYLVYPVLMIYLTTLADAVKSERGSTEGARSPRTIPIDLNISITKLKSYS